MRLVISHAATRHAVTANAAPWQALLHRNPFSSSSHHKQLDTVHGPDCPPRPPILAAPLVPTPNPHARNIAVLGGGITGLTATFQLARTIPNAKITLFEKSDRLGGWLDSEVVQVDGGEVLFEWGPRSLRPNLTGPGQATLLLLAQLRLSHECIGVDKRAPAALSRFIYYPDRLVRMPSPYENPVATLWSVLTGLLTQPIFSGIFGSILAEFSVKPRHPNTSDESVGDFLRRRFGRAVADNLASAVFHGIYAGDIYKLSARTCLPALWYLETRDPDGSGILAELADFLFRRQNLVSTQRARASATNTAREITRGGSYYAWDDLVQLASRSALYTFASGIGVLATRLREVLSENENVSVKTGFEVSSLRYDRDRGQILVGQSTQDSTSSFDYVVSTLRPGTMENLVRSRPTTPTNAHYALKEANKAATVMVVNLYFRSEQLLPKEYAGFGYLIPRSVPLDQNPERALGVIFASEMTAGGRGPGIIQKNNPISAQELEHVKHTLKDFKLQAKMFRNMQAHYERYPDPILEIAAQIRDSRTDLEVRVMELEAVVERGGAPERETRRTGQDTAPGTKLGVMLGGHWWDGWEESDYPSEEEAINMAKNVLRRHLNITEEPMVAKARLQRDCIPQYPVGYRDYMAQIHKKILIDEFKGRLKVAGPWWQGAVAVNDCIRKAREAVMAIEHRWEESTGLEDYAEKEKWYLYNKRTGKLEIDPMCG